MAPQGSGSIDHDALRSHYGVAADGPAMEENENQSRRIAVETDIALLVEGIQGVIQKHGLQSRKVMIGMWGSAQ